MAALEEGCQYGLFSNVNSSSRRSVVHVKLTDTSLKLIEDYLKRKPLAGQKPCIQFQGSHGTISIPENGDKARAFQFSLSAIQADRRGSFDCIQQPDTKGSSQLRLEGTMSSKINIHATNELFQMTKDRVTQAELDSKKSITKVIKQSGPNISRRRTTVMRQPAPSHHSVPKHQTALPAKPKPSTAPPVNFSKRPSPSYASQGHAVSPHNPTVVSSTSTKPLSPSLHSSTSATSRSSSSRNSAVMSMPYRDRIIHLLAVRPYKKPELIIRLRKDGVGDKDKDSLGTILNQVAVLKDNSFTLARHGYSDVRLDWPFYSEEDKNIVKKKQSSLSSSSPAPSPANRSPDSPSSTSVQQKRPDIQKRPIEDSSSSQHKRHLDDTSSHHAAKKKRISLYEIQKGSSKADANSSDRRMVSSTTDKSDKKENIESSDNIASSTSHMPEYYGKYCSIQSTDQRRRYKEEFNTEYDEYRDLHTNIEKVSKKFHELEVLLRKTPKDSNEFENLQDRIRSEYRVQKNDPKYTEQKKRFEYLHGKLAYIKKLILDYDNLQTSMCS